MESYRPMLWSKKMIQDIVFKWPQFDLWLNAGACINMQLVREIAPLIGNFVIHLTMALLHTNHSENQVLCEPTAPMLPEICCNGQGHFSCSLKEGRHVLCNKNIKRSAKSKKRECGKCFLAYHIW